MYWRELAPPVGLRRSWLRVEDAILRYIGQGILGVDRRRCIDTGRVLKVFLPTCLVGNQTGMRLKGQRTGYHATVVVSAQFVGIFLCRRYRKGRVRGDWEGSFAIGQWVVVCKLLVRCGLGLEPPNVDTANLRRCAFLTVSVPAPDLKFFICPR